MHCTNLQYLLKQGERQAKDLECKINIIKAGRLDIEEGLYPYLTRKGYMIRIDLLSIVTSRVSRTTLYYNTKKKLRT